MTTRWQRPCVSLSEFVGLSVAILRTFPQIRDATCHVTGGFLTLFVIGVVMCHRGMPVAAGVMPVAGRGAPVGAGIAGPGVRPMLVPGGSGGVAAGAAGAGAGVPAMVARSASAPVVGPAGTPSFSSEDFPSLGRARSVVVGGVIVPLPSPPPFRRGVVSVTRLTASCVSSPRAHPYEMQRRVVDDGVSSTLFCVTVGCVHCMACCPVCLLWPALMLELT